MRRDDWAELLMDESKAGYGIRMAGMTVGLPPGIARCAVVPGPSVFMFSTERWTPKALDCCQIRPRVSNASFPGGSKTPPSGLARQQLPLLSCDPVAYGVRCAWSLMNCRGTAAGKVTVMVSGAVPFSATVTPGPEAAVVAPAGNDCVHAERSLLVCSMRVRSGDSEASVRWNWQVTVPALVAVWTNEGSEGVDGWVPAMYSNRLLTPSLSASAEGAAAGLSENPRPK